MRIFRHYVLVSMLILVTVEALILVLAPSAAHALLYRAPMPVIDVNVITAFFSIVALVVLSALGLYSRRQRSRLIGRLLRAFVAVTAGTIAAACGALLPGVHGAGSAELALAAMLAFAGLCVTRIAFDRVADEQVFKRRVLIYGAGHRAMSVLQLRRRSDQRGFHVVGFVSLDRERPVVSEEHCVAARGRLRDFCRVENVDEVVVAMDDRRQEFPLHELIACRLAGINIVDIVDFLERETGKVRLDVLNPSWLIFSPGFDRSPVREFSKRSLDLLASLALLVLSLPLLLLTVVAIKVEDGLRAPVLYRQRRVGLDGRIFDVLKFRSMRVNAEVPGRAIWAQQNDTRVTRVGALIRKVRIDELPQIFNVLRGDMSIVGPRPERPEFVSGLENRIPYYHERHCVKPGITGWAQLCYPYGSSEHDAAEKLQYDLYYIKNHSLLFDAMILLQTAEVVLWGKGAR